ncbi:MAG TPA: hypothetical protein VJ386_07835 [Candidatus Deferrimicrobiaceae bacterium]|jgi:hypothetical protein|nr:hypothetical protein [Candidatus Deferrimicrobiaceae bacterium]
MKTDSMAARRADRNRGTFQGVFVIRAVLATLLPARKERVP